MNWFQRHLNVTAILLLAAIGFISGFLIMIVAPDITDDQFRGMIFFIGFIAQFPVLGWLISQKKRKLWNVLWLILPFGWIIVLSLKDYRVK